MVGPVLLSCQAARAGSVWGFSTAVSEPDCLVPGVPMNGQGLLPLAVSDPTFFLLSPPFPLKSNLRRGDVSLSGLCLFP